MSHITFVLGGVKSGKSAYSLNEANLLQGKKAFIATAEGLDAEMKARIARHKQERQNHSWETFEEPLHIADILPAVERDHEVMIIDCLTLWVSNLFHAGLNPEAEFNALASALLACHTSHIYIVSNEVGMGIVPEYRLSREYREQLGLLNKMIAHIASRVVLMVAGISLEIKGETCEEGRTRK